MQQRKPTLANSKSSSPTRKSNEQRRPEALLLEAPPRIGLTPAERTELVTLADALAAEGHLADRTAVA